MKNGEVIELYETLKRLSENKNLKFNVKLAYIMARNKEKLRQEAVLIYDMRRQIIMEHGRIEDKDIIVPKEYVDEVNQKINELMDVENDVEIIQVPTGAFGDQELNLEDMEGLMNMIFLEPLIATEPPIIQEKTPE